MLVRSTKIILAAALIATAAQGQQGEAPTSTGETGLFTLVDAWGPPAGSWTFGLRYDNWDRLVAPVPGRPLLPGETDDWDYDHHRLAVNLGFALGDRFEVALSLPWEKLDAQDVNHVGVVNGRFFDGRIDADGVGNARLGGKLRLWQDESAGSALAGRAWVDLPTGDDEDGLVTGDTGFGAGLAWSINPNWVANLDYRDRGDADGFDVPEEIGAGVGHVAELSSRLDWITEVVATLYQGGDSRPDDMIDLATGGRYRFGADRRWALDFGLRLELGQLPDTDEHCPIGGLLGISYAPSRRAAAAPVAAPPPLAPTSPTAPAPTPAPSPTPSPAPVPAEPSTATPPAAPPTATEPPAATAPVAPPPAPTAPAEHRETVHFDSSSARLSNIAKAKLDEVALRLQQTPAATVEISGHADSSGDAAANEALSARRAEAARDYLVSRHGIDAGRIRVVGRGEAEPAADDADAAGRRENRRAVIVVRVPS